MPDIEDELLALAGGNESSDEEEEEVMSERESRDESASPSPAKKGAARDGSRKAPAKRGKKRTDDDSDEEEGEAYSAPGSPNSIGSAAMEESDSETENVGRATGADDDEKYPVDGMFTSHAEKAQIMSLREVERESIIAERTTEIERQRQNRMLRQLVSKQENEEKRALKIRKRTASSADLEDDDRKSSRQRTETKTSAGIDTLRRARAEKNDRARAREENRRPDRHSPHRGRRGSSVASSRSRGSYDDKGRSPSPQANRELPPPGIRDFERIRVGRSRFAQYCFNPGFEDALTGCYVRVSLGPDPAGVDQYRMAKIKAFTTGKPYAITGPGGSFVTDQYVLVQHGKSPKEFAFIFCSDKPFTEREYNRYVTVMSNDGLSLPKTQQLLNKIDDINRFVGRSLTNDEIGEKVERKRALRAKFDPERRERLGRELEEAKMAGRTAQAQEIQDELDDMQSNRLAFRTTLSPMKGSTVSTSQQDRLADINRERRRQNAANVGKAQLKEKAEARRRELALERGEATDMDMTGRIRTRTKFVHDEKKQNGEKPSAAASQNGTPKLGPKEGELLPHIAKALESARLAEKKGLPSIHRPICDDDIIGNIDLDLDIEID